MAEPICTIIVPATGQPCGNPAVRLGAFPVCAACQPAKVELSPGIARGRYCWGCDTVNLSIDFHGIAGVEGMLECPNPSCRARRFASLFPYTAEVSQEYTRLS